MLPDYPKAKAELDRYLAVAFAYGRDPMLLDIQAAPIHEGNRARIIRSDGSQDEIHFQRHLAHIDIEESEYKYLTWNDVVQRVMTAGKDMGTSIAKNMFETIDEITKRTGNRADIHGRELTPEVLFSMLKKMELSCDDNGEVKMPTFICGDSASNSMISLLNKIDSSPDLKRKLESIIAEKKEKWRDRENCRKLVG